MSEQPLNTTPEQSQEQLPALDETYKTYLESMADTPLTVVRGAGSEEQRLEGGWHLTGKIEYFEGSDKPWVTVANDEGDKRVRIDALMYYNPLEQGATAEQHIAPETAQELGHEAVAKTIDVAETDAESDTAKSIEQQLTELKQKVRELIVAQDAEVETINAVLLPHAMQMQQEAEGLLRYLHAVDERMPLVADTVLKGRIAHLVGDLGALYRTLQEEKKSPAVFAKSQNVSEAIAPLLTNDELTQEQRTQLLAMSQLLEDGNRVQAQLGRRLDINDGSSNLVATSAQFLGTIHNLDSAINLQRAQSIDAVSPIQLIDRDLRAYIEGLKRQVQQSRSVSEQLAGYSAQV